MIAINSTARLAARRREILAQACRLFGRHGFERTSVGMIARAAGISQGLLYNYFASKDALLSALFDETMREVSHTFAAAAHVRDPHERLERIVRAASDALRRHLDFWRLSYGMRMRPTVLTSHGGALLTWTAELKQLLASYAADAGLADPELEGELLFALIDGVCQHYVLEPNRYPLDAVTERILRRYRRAIPA